jgi:uncharacterized protein (DUF2236 family)
MPGDDHGRPRTHAERLASRDGYFAPESVIRRVGNTPVTPFLGGGAAVLLQMAHPLVAAGVAAHSGYRRDLWRRLGRTLRALYLITYGSKAEAEQAAATVRAVHGTVSGTTATRLGRFPAGTPYSAGDPELQLWVHATLVHASLEAYQRFERRLTEAEQERYYREMTLMATIFGVPERIVPRSLRAFRDYFRTQVEGDTIAVTAPAREIGEVILRAPMPAPVRLITPAHRLATAALLPPRLRDEYGLGWTRLHELALQPAARALRITAMPLVLAAAHLRPPVVGVRTSALRTG